MDLVWVDWFCWYLGSCLCCVSFNHIKDILDASKTSRDIDIDADFDIAIDVYSSIFYVDENVCFDVRLIMLAILMLMSGKAVKRDFQKKLGFGPSHVSGQSQLFKNIFY